MSDSSPAVKVTVTTFAVDLIIDHALRQQPTNDGTLIKPVTGILVGEQSDGKIIIRHCFPGFFTFHEIVRLIF